MTDRPFSVKRVTAGNTGNPLPADGHPRPTVRLHSGSVPKDLTPVHNPVDNRHSYVAPAAATRQSRTAGAQRFVTPHRRAGPRSLGWFPAYPSSVSGDPYCRPLHNTETFPDVQPGTWAPATAEGGTGSCAAALVLDEVPRAAAALDRFSDPLHVRGDQRNGIAACPAPCCLLGRHHAYQVSRASCSFLSEPGQILRVAVSTL